MFAGYKAAKDSNVDKKFKELNWEMDCWIGTTSTYLFGVDDLTDMLNQANKKEHYNAILDHMYRFDATRVDYYKDIENKIIDRMWPK
jgi:hypothetical protein